LYTSIQVNSIASSLLNVLSIFLFMWRTQTHSKTNSISLINDCRRYYIYGCIFCHDMLAT